MSTPSIRPIPARRRALARRLAGLATACAASVLLVTGASAADAAVVGTLYDDPGTSADAWVGAHGSDPRAALIRARIAEQPTARWITTPDAAAAARSVSDHAGAARAAGAVPVLVAYALPDRDCGGASAGGVNGLAGYDGWVAAFAGALGQGPSIVLLEPDSLALQDCLSADRAARRGAALSRAVSTIVQRSPQARVFLDGGHSAWHSPAVQAERLRAAGVGKAAGFFSNVSNFRATADELAYGRALRGILGDRVQQLVDTSRNGRGPAGTEWCDPAGRGVGESPTLDTGDPAVAGYVWVKPPGEADGCAAAAGTFVPALAHELAGGAARR